MPDHELIDARLKGEGRVEWARLVESASGLTCAWADYDGFHIGPCPTTASPYTHIWGWSDDGLVLMRGRIDNQHVTVGWLRLAPDAADGDKVKCVARDLLTWRSTNERLHVRFASGDQWPEKMRQVEVLGERPVTFISEQVPAE